MTSTLFDSMHDLSKKHKIVVVSVWKREKLNRLLFRRYFCSIFLGFILSRKMPPLAFSFLHIIFSNSNVILCRCSFLQKMWRVCRFREEILETHEQKTQFFHPNFPMLWFFARFFGIARNIQNFKIIVTHV